jgi:hypothetical protein
MIFFGPRLKNDQQKRPPSSRRKRAKCLLLSCAILVIMMSEFKTTLHQVDSLDSHLHHEANLGDKPQNSHRFSALISVVERSLNPDESIACQEGPTSTSVSVNMLL